MCHPQVFYEFNTTHWKGFPRKDDPSAPPMFSGAGVEVLYKILPTQRTLFLPVVTR